MRFRALRRPDIPLFVHLLAFVLVSLVAAELVNIAIVLTLPRPEPEFYSLSDVEQVLSGEDAASGAARSFKVEVKTAPPAESGDNEFRRRVEKRLARDLAIAPDNVVFTRQASSPFSLGPPPRLLQGPNGQRWPALIRRQFAFLPQSRGGARDEPQVFLVAPFTVAIRLANGAWRVAEPKRQGLLEPWERRVLLWFLGSAAALTPFAYLYARRLAAPIAAFASAAERLGRDHNAPPLKVTGSAEIRVAANAFNDMQERLNRYVHDRTSMIGAVAHDLRTPLTRLRFRIEEVPEELRAKMAEDIAQMHQMVAEVLSFVRDTGQPGIHARLELSSLLDSVVDDFAELGADVSVQHAERAVVEGDSLALRRMFANLIDNAIKFGGRARAHLRSAEGVVVVDIEDDGPGLPARELESVFEPFRRAEPSRSRNTGGTGLGLTVARSIARAHGGDVTLDNRADGGLLARVRLPI